MEYIEHKTIAGERWDQLAYRYYGSATLYEPIIRANPYVAITPILDAGITLRIPLLEQDEFEEELGDLPPWRQ